MEQKILQNFQKNLWWLFPTKEITSKQFAGCRCEKDIGN